MATPLSLFLILFLLVACSQARYNYRPQLHFSVPKGWQSDPNGPIFYQGEYHIYYEYVAGSDPLHKQIVTDKQFPPMGWGHAVSKDLLTWKDMGVALPHDQKTIVFSGSVVLDKDNTAGFKQSGKHGDVLVAMYTRFKLTKLVKFDKEEIDPNADNQVQSLAYSTDGGNHFTKLVKPVMENTFRDKHFRDPKIFRYEDYWVAIVAAGDKIRFYRSNNLKSWRHMSDFGVGKGSHQGMWECPSLFKVKLGANYKWVLLVSIDYQPEMSGGPNGGSATQYFVGNFDGEKFTSSQKETLWLDWGPDYYAAVNFQGLPEGKHVVMAWMNNWIYADFSPTITDGWNGQMALPRELSLLSVRGNPRLVSKPIEAIGKLKVALVQTPTTLKLKGGEVHSINLNGNSNTPPLFHVHVTMLTSSEATLCFTNGKHEVCVGHEQVKNTIFIDRTKSGSHTFGVKDITDKFYKRNRAVRETRVLNVPMDVYLDANSVEVFADGGLVTMTSLVFPDEPFTKLEIRQSTKNPRGPNTLSVTNLEISTMLGVSTNASPGRPPASACKPPGSVRRFFNRLCGGKSVKQRKA